MDVPTLKRSLEKAHNDSDFTAIFDILRVLENEALSVDTIMSSRLGNLVAEIKKSATASQHAKAAEVLGKTKSLLISWKRIVEKNKGSRQSAPSPSPSPASSNASKLTLKLSSSELQQDNLVRRSKLSEAREKVVILLTNNLKKVSGDTAVTENLARDIEEAINNRIPSEKSGGKDYHAKVRTLVFNLKRNESLRNDLLSRIVSCAALVSMTAEQLATSELRDHRKQTIGDNLEERRTDWAEEHRSEIQRDIGIEEGNVWIYDAGEISDAGD